MIKVTKVDNPDNMNFHPEDVHLQNFRMFVRICNFTLPPEFEIEYGKLSDLTMKFYSLCRNLGSCNYERKRSEGSIKVHEQSLVELEKVEKEQQQQFMSMIKNSFDNSFASGYGDVTVATEKLKDIRWQREEKERKLKNAKQDYQQAITTLQTIKDTLEQSFADLVSQLQVVAELKNKSNIDLENIQIKSDFLFYIDKMKENPKTIAAYKRLLTSFITLRVECFKVIEYMAQKMVVSYKEQTLLKDFTDVELANLELADGASEAVSINEHDISMGSDIFMYSSEMDLISRHFKGEELSSEYIESFGKVKFGEEFDSLIKKLAGIRHAMELEKEVGRSR